MTARRGQTRTNHGKERLIDAAQVLTATRPFDEITVDEISKAAGLSRPTFYYHFADGKEELRTELVQRGCLKDTATHDTRRAIVEAAIRAFARSGVSATTVEDIASEAGVTRGTLCWHFHSKDDLLEALVKYGSPYAILRSAIEQIDRDLQQGVLTDDEIIFRRYAGAFYDAFTRQGDIARLAVLVIHTHPEIARIIAKRIVEGRKVITQYVKKRQDEGYFRKDIDPAFFVQVMAMSFIMRAVGQGLYDFLPFAHLSREEVIDQIVSLLLHGITQHDSSCHT